MASLIRERALDGRIRIRISEVNQLVTGSGLPSPACPARICGPELLTPANSLVVNRDFSFVIDLPFDCCPLAFFEAEFRGIVLLERNLTRNVEADYRIFVFSLPYLDHFGRYTEVEVVENRIGDSLNVDDFDNKNQICSLVRNCFGITPPISKLKLFRLLSFGDSKSYEQQEEDWPDLFHAERFRAPSPDGGRWWIVDESCGVAKSFRLRAVRAWVTRLVCAQHGHVVNGVRVPCGNTRNHESETKPPSEANSGRVTHPGKEG
jgi:hypothetical protein